MFSTVLANLMICVHALHESCVACVPCCNAVLFAGSSRTSVTADWLPPMQHDMCTAYSLECTPKALKEPST